MSTPIEAPRYGIAAGSVIRGVVYRATEIEHSGWPTREMAPLNEAARRIDYYGKRLDPFCPKTPWNATHQCFYLPAELPRMGRDMRVQAPRLHKGRIVFDGAGSELAPPVPEHQATPDMPRYRVRGLNQVGRHLLEGPDEIITFLAWPTEAFEPVNAAAKAVAAYAEANRGRTDMLPSPWCLYRRGLFLPALKELVQRPNGNWMEPPRPAGLPWAAKAYPDGSYQPLDATKYADAIASEVASVTGKRPGEPGTLPPTYPSGTPSRINRARPLPARE